jgi:uncharacterized protein YraI
MRLHPIAATILCLLAALPASAQQTFPYKAHVVADDVYVRSGPGKNYYPTTKLQTGDVVEVYRHDPGGWYAIRPPEGNFEWISARYLDIRNDGLAEVASEGVAARVGSDFSDIRDVIQVRLHQGELVEVLDSAEFSSGPDAGKWCKIAPPSGAFRWVHGKYVDLDSPRQGIRKTPPGPNPLTDPQVGQRAADAAEPSQIQPARLQSPDPSDESAVRGANHWTPVTGRAAEDDRQPQPAVEPDRDPELYTNEFAERASDPAGSVTMRRISPEEFQAQLDKVNMDLSSMLVEEPTVWSLGELEVRTQSLLTQAETAVERGRVRLLVKRIEQARDIKERYIAVNDMETDIARHNRQLATLERRRREPDSKAALEQRFDGAGKLRRVVSTTIGAPQYALVDEAGNVRCFVTPAPGVNMQYYLGREVGVTGIRGFIPDRGAQHVTAKHVTPLEDPTVLR